MTAAQRAALYGPNNPDAPRATSQVSERQAEAKQAELAREKQHQEALNSDTVAVDFARPAADVMQTQPRTTAATPSSSVMNYDNRDGSPRKAALSQSWSRSTSATPISQPTTPPAIRFAISPEALPNTASRITARPLSCPLMPVRILSPLRPATATKLLTIQHS
jgi:hypothetical protein